MTVLHQPALTEESPARASWFPMLVIALAQIQMGFNVSALPVSIGGIVEDFNTSPSSVSTALVVYSLAVAGFVMLGAKLGKVIGSRLAFQLGVIVHGLAMAGMAVSTSTGMMIQMQAIAGLAAAMLVPSLVVLIASHYHGLQQSQSLGLLGASQAIAGVLAFLVIGVLGTLFSWRYGFALIVVIAAVVFVLSFRLRPVERYRGLKIDAVGALLAALSIILISVGFNNLKVWGMLLASPDAPVSLLGMSPSPIMIAAGIIVGQGFFAWTRRRQDQNKTPLLHLGVLESPQERAAIFCLFIIAGLGPAVNFLIPLYIQIVQGFTSLQTAVAVIPYSLAIFASAALVVRLFERWTPRHIGRVGFLVVGVGLAMLAYAISNDWGTPLVILSLIVIGLGEGALLTLVFNVLVSSSPKELAGDVGALRGTANNLATGLGTAFASILSVTLLSLIVVNSLISSPAISTEVIEEQIDLDNIDFVSNEQLDEVLEETDLTPRQEAEVVDINVLARLQSLKISFLVLAGIALLAVIPAGGLPAYKPEEVPEEMPP
ncbi:MAG TPA: MFS transporter [Anaerolineales bacterium]|nr:MFS transporter [Anaerolineales bacterium]